MNYEIITSRWLCQECGGAVRLHFSRSEAVLDEFVCDGVACEEGHPIPDEMMAQEMIAQADEEFYAAMERGEQITQIWKAPEQVEQDQN